MSRLMLKNHLSQAGNYREMMENGYRSLSRRDEPTTNRGAAKKLDPSTLERVRILATNGYRTQIPLPENQLKFVDRLFNCGEIAEFQHWKACDLIKRGIAEPVEAAG